MSRTVKGMIAGYLVLLSLPFLLAFSQKPIQTDHAFDGGSKIKVSSLSPVQTENLYVLGKVWGFLKYHHPAVTQGKRHWDYDLIRLMPSILAAPDRPAANQLLNTWINDLGPIATCSACVTLGTNDVQMRPRIDWINNAAVLGSELSASLQHIYRNRDGKSKQFYITMANNGNPTFPNELDYKDLSFPDAGFQLLALFRAWNMVEYWAPYRDQIDVNWDQALKDAIVNAALANERLAYEREMLALYALTTDTHANIWNTLRSRPPAGDCGIAVHFRFVEGRPIVLPYADEAAGKASGLKPGDLLEAVDGTSIDDLVRAWSPHYAASNVPTRLRDLSKNLAKGACGKVTLRVRRETGVEDVVSERLPLPLRRADLTHDREGKTFQMLADDIAYIKLSSIRRADVRSYIESAKATTGLVIDIRNYPGEFVPFELGQHLIDQPVEFARFTYGEITTPGAFRWTSPLSIRPKAPHYQGKVMILVDEVSQSQAEYTTMALRASPKAKVIGSTTAGADGDLSSMPLPGGLTSAISGLGVFYPDKRPTQRIGIIPDIEVKPTIAGMRAGRDEVLDAAIAEIRRH